jgi:membrane protein implicated in regulation of membrane protease activity
MAVAVAVAVAVAEAMAVALLALAVAVAVVTVEVVAVVQQTKLKQQAPQASMWSGATTTTCRPITRRISGFEPKRNFRRKSKVGSRGFGP